MYPSQKQAEASCSIKEVQPKIASQNIPIYLIYLAMPAGSSKSQQQCIKALMQGESTVMSLDFIEAQEKELVKKVCTWTLQLLMYPPAFVCLFEYLSGQGLAEMINPGSIVVSCLLVRIFAKEASTQGATVLAVLAITGF